MKRANDAGPLLCPSAHTAAPGARLFGVQVRTEGGERQLAYLTETHPITEKVMKLAGSGAPRGAARCRALRVSRASARIGTEKVVGWRRVWRLPYAAARGFSAAALCYSPALSVVQAGRTGGMRQCPQVATIDQHPSDALGATVAQLESRRMMSFCSRIAPESLFLNGSGTAADLADQRGE